MTEGLNHPDVWKPADLQSAFYLVGGENPDLHEKNPAILARKMGDLITNGATVLEVGCGFGRILVALERYLTAIQKPDVKLIGSDFCREMLYLGENYIPKDSRIELFYHNENGVPLPEQSVDVIYTQAVLIHCDRSQVESIFRECRRLIKAGGWMRHDFKDGNSVEEVEHCEEVRSGGFPVFAYSIEEIYEIARKTGFEMDRTTWNKPGRRAIHFFKPK